MIPTSTREVLLQAQNNLTALRHMLDLLQAWEEGTELASVVRKTRGELALLHESLEDAKASHAGFHLLDELMRKDNLNESPDPDEVFTLAELYESEAHNTFAFQRDLRVIWQAWENSTTPQQLGELTDQAGLGTTCGYRAAAVLHRYFYEIDTEA
jgi:N6-adenosine-specific RNA methylase IME4